MKSQNISEIIENIPKEDKARLHSLFSFLVKRDHFAYTLFGDKPISLSGHFILSPWENTLEHIPSDGIFWKNWEVWEKYKGLFPLRNYMILREKQNFANFDIDFIIIVNKKEFIKVVNDHLNLFEAILGTDLDPQKFLNEIESGVVSLTTSIRDNEMLWGILLGYGKHNAILYNKREREYYNHKLLRSHALIYSTIKLESCGDYKFYPYLIDSVQFVGDINNQETKLLREKYRKLRGEISALYAQGDFLEITLSKLTKD